MFDALIVYADGHTAALEIVTDTDPDQRQLWARIQQHGGQVIAAPELTHTWNVTVDNGAPIRELRNQIVDLLRHIENPTIALELDWPDGRRWHDAAGVNAIFEGLGVLRASPTRRPAPAEVIISPNPQAGWAGAPNDVATWAVEVLTTTAADVPTKLGASAHVERHAFIWATITTDVRITLILDGDELPDARPDLPDHVTDLWVGGWYGGARVLRFDPRAGWSTAYRIPPDGRINLTTSPHM